MILKIDNLVVNYGYISALRGINIEVNKGEVVTLIGGNGAGKTTTLMSISGLTKKRHWESICIRTYGYNQYADSDKNSKAGHSSRA